MAAAAAERVDLHFNVPQSRAYGAIAQRQTVTIPWGRGVGKSWFSEQIAFLLVSQWRHQWRTAAPKPFRGIRVVFLMPTLKQFKDVHGLAYERNVEEDWAFLRGKLDRTTWQTRFPDGSWIQPFPAELYSSKRARGMRCDVLLTDETDDIDRDVFESVARPWFSEPWSLKMRICGGTPTRGRHGLLWHLHQLGLSKEATAERYHSFHATYRDAPETVDAEEVEDARANSPLATFQREWECNFDAGEGLVYPFDDRFHVRPAPPVENFQSFVVGMDHGDVDPGVLLLIGIQGHGRDAVAWVLDEHYETECPNQKWNERARKWSFAKFWPDPSRADRIRDIRGLGINVGETDNNILGGVARVADMLFRRTSEAGVESAHLYVAPQCVNTIREFGLYRRKKHSDGTFDEDPEDKNNHCLVAGTRVLTKRGELAIERIVPGDNVLTRSGWRPVHWSGQTFGSAPIWRLETNRGTIEGTPDHRVWTENRGWVRLDALRYGDTLSSWESTAEQNESRSAGKSSDGTQGRAHSTSQGTSGPASAAAPGSCTGCSGRPTTAGPSRTDIMSTIETGTRSTTPETIWSAYPRESTSAITGNSERQRVSLTWSESGHLLPSGTEQPRGEPGTPSTRARHSPSESHSRQSALTAPRSSNPLGDERRIGFVRTHASQHGGEQAASMTSNAAALSAPLSSRSTGTAPPRLVPALVLGSSPAGRSAPVYDLTVFGDHEFFANGVLVSNSMDALRYAIVGRFGRGENTRHVVSGR